MGSRDEVSGTNSPKMKQVGYIQIKFNVSYNETLYFTIRYDTIRYDTQFT